MDPQAMEASARRARRSVLATLLGSAALAGAYFVGNASPAYWLLLVIAALTAGTGIVLFLVFVWERTMS